jgi:hypothetical protein
MIFQALRLSYLHLHKLKITYLPTHLIMNVRIQHTLGRILFILLIILIYHHVAHPTYSEFRCLQSK